MNRLHHVAIKTNRLDWYVHFFKEVFGMNIRKEKSDSGKRKIWFKEGVQNNETVGENRKDDYVDHIAISTDEMCFVMKKARQYGCVQIKENWIELPDGLKIEFIEK